MMNENELTNLINPIEQETNTQEQETNTQEQETNTENSNLVNGKIKGAPRVYMRSQASIESEPVTILDENTNVVINLSDSTDDFYKISVNELSGYCVKNFVVIY